MAKLKGLDFVTASEGTVRLGVGTHNGSYAGFWVNEDGTTFTSLACGSTDVTSEVGANGGVTFNKGAVITTAREKFTQVVVSAGSVNAIKDL